MCYTYFLQNRSILWDIDFKWGTIEYRGIVIMVQNIDQNIYCWIQWWNTQIRYLRNTGDEMY